MPAARWQRLETYCNNYNRRSTLSLIRTKMNLRTSRSSGFFAIIVCTLALPISVFAQQQPAQQQPAQQQPAQSQPAAQQEPSTIIKAPPPPAPAATAPAAPSHRGMI